MSEQNDISTSETEEKLVSAPPLALNIAVELPPHRARRRNRSEAWNHFTVEPNSDKRAKCNYCSSLIKYDSGTSAMRAHLMRCRNSPNNDGRKRQKSVSSPPRNAEEHCKRTDIIVKPISDQDDFSTSETAENLVSTPQLTSDTANGFPPHFVGRRNRSEAWNHFTIEPGSDKRARCNYCTSTIKYDNGTSAMRSHTMRCKNSPYKDGSKRPIIVPSSTIKVGEHISSPSPPLFDKFDQEACRNALVKMFVSMDLPIPFVENKLFQKFLNVLQPKFSVSSRTTLMRDILNLRDVERTKLKSFLSQHCGRVCLTIDTWVSSKDLTYTCLTVHFVDNNWTLHKKILNFCPIASLGEGMAKTVELCLNHWGLNHVFCLTVDNVSPNDFGIQYLKKMLMSWNSLVLKGDYIHMHCCAHLLNMIVKEGLEDIDDSILRISAAVEYIRSSPSTLSKFEALANQEKIEFKGPVCLDVETNWNLTYEMLEAALKHQKTFEELELQDKEYVQELEKGKGVPTYEDWDSAYLILPILKIFHEAILRISCTFNVTSSIYMLEVFGVHKRICQLCHSRNITVRLIAKRMKKSYDKHWGSPDALNMLLLIAIVFDPRYKVGYINWMINQIFDSGEAANLKDKLESCLKSLFEEYNNGNGEPQNDSHKAQSDEDGKEDLDPYSWNQFLQSRKSSVKSELNKYLEEDIETSPELDILNWWKLNSSRFPILANIAREILAIPVSTIAPEFAFSTDAKVLDSYCSSLTPELVEALICAQDWICGTPVSLLSNEDMEKLKQEMISHQAATCSTFLTPDG